MQKRFLSDAGVLKVQIYNLRYRLFNYYLIQTVLFYLERYNKNLLVTITYFNVHYFINYISLMYCNLPL